jgi:hypothetical protein
MAPPPAALGLLRNFSLEIASLEQLTSEAITHHSRHASISAREALSRFLGDLEFSHTSRANVLREHAAALAAECALIPPNHRSEQLPFTPSVTLSTEAEDLVAVTYSNLNLLAASYTRLHTLAVAFEHDATALISLNHLKSITPKIMECSQAIPLLTAEIARERFGHIFPGTAEAALNATQAAWKNETHFSDVN